MLKIIQNIFQRPGFGKTKEKWTADLSRPEKSFFDIKPEISRNAYPEKGSLFIGLKNKSYATRLETPVNIFSDQVINARFRIESPGTKCAAGIMFRMKEKGTYYLAQVSNENFFRFDLIRNGVSKPLIGWIHAYCPGAVSAVRTGGRRNRGSLPDVKLNIIARGDYFIFLVNGKWVAEIRDDSIPGGRSVGGQKNEGRLGFSFESYEITENNGTGGNDHQVFANERSVHERYLCQAWLDFLSVDSRKASVEAEYEKWKDNPEISAESRLYLAESLTFQGRAGEAYDQILKTWKRREEAARSVTATYTEMRARGELLLAARTAERLGKYENAEEYINAYFTVGIAGSVKDPGVTDAIAVKAKLLSFLGKYGDLAEFLSENIKRAEKSGGEPREPALTNPSGTAADSADMKGLPVLHALFGYACMNLQNYKSAAEAWDKAFSLDPDNGLYAVSAADAYEMTGDTKAALNKRLEGGKCFLRQEDNTELEKLIPKLTAAGKRSREARELVEKWAAVSGNVLVKEEKKEKAIKKSTALNSGVTAKRKLKQDTVPEVIQEKSIGKPEIQAKTTKPDAAKRIRNAVAVEVLKQPKIAKMSVDTEKTAKKPSAKVKPVKKIQTATKLKAVSNKLPVVTKPAVKKQAVKTVIPKTPVRKIK